MNFIFSGTIAVWVCALIILSGIWSGKADAEINTWTPNPTVNAWGTSGLPQTVSAEALGAGRISFSLQGAWYRQKEVYPGTPNFGSNIATGEVFLAFGASDYIDIFGGINLYNSTRYEADWKSGLGTVVGGAQATLPFLHGSPVRLGMQGAVLGGVSKNQINSNYVDGYNYFETRTGYDLMGKLLESVIIGKEYCGFKLHFNQGLVKSTQAGKDLLLTMSGGLQGNIIPFLSIGFEANSRTFLKKRAFRTDPVWVTPSLTFKSPTYISLTIGSDIAVVRKRNNDPALKSLESYRLFSDLVFSFNSLKVTHHGIADKIRRDSIDQVRCRKEVRRLAASENILTQRLMMDSLVAAHQVRACDSIARKYQDDSIALAGELAEAKGLLELEKTKHNGAEKKQLSTRLLPLNAVFFNTGKTELLASSRPGLKRVAEMLERFPELEVEIGGHSDNVGSPEKNQLLSQRRAEAVRNFLVEIVPGLAGRVSAIGYGASMPIADNKTAEGRKINRRVDLKVLNSDVLKEYK
jgi:outer membrane protein OmpA-like peptidoglycan-associated protein